MVSCSEFLDKTASPHLKRAWSSSGWTHRGIFRAWLEEFNAYHRARHQQAFLIIDDIPAHQIDGVVLTHVTVTHVPPALAAPLQPLRQGVTAAFKKQYRHRYIERLLDQGGELDETIGWYPESVKKFREIEWISKIWETLAVHIIWNSWHLAGVTPDSVYLPFLVGKGEPKFRADYLKAVWMAKFTAPMDVDSFLSPPDEDTLPDRADEDEWGVEWKDGSRPLKGMLEGAAGYDK